MNKVKKLIWFSLGMLFLGISYIGVVTPGIPWSTPAVAAAYCFARSSKRWHDWIMNHKLFGPFLKNWSEKRIFPVYGKWAMVITMDISLITLWFTTHNWKLVLLVGAGMTLCAIWALRYPSNIAEYDTRKALGKKIGWFS